MYWIQHQITLCSTPLDTAQNKHLSTLQDLIHASKCLLSLLGDWVKALVNCTYTSIIFDMLVKALMSMNVERLSLSDTLIHNGSSVCLSTVAQGQRQYGAQQQRTRAPEAPAIDDESYPAPLDATALGPAVNAAARVDATVATGFMAYNQTTTYRSWTA